MKPNSFEDRYRSGDTPWDHDTADTNLIETVSHHRIAPCRILEIGCGTGANAVWLAGQGFDVVACDLSETAIAKARARAAAAGAECRFLVADFLHDPPSGAQFAFVFDRGCLHCIEAAEERRRFAAEVAARLDPGGLWLTLVGNADEPKREVGPPQLSAGQLVSVVEPCFELISLRSGHFGSDQENPPRAWICLARRR